MTDSDQQIPNSNLDVYLNGIREKFNLLNRELDEARNQRDEFRRNCMVLLREFTGLTQTDRHEASEELQELRQTVFASNSKGRIVCRSCGTSNDDLSPILSPVSPCSESYFSIHEESAGSDLLHNWRQDGRNQLREIYASHEDEKQNGSTIPGNSSRSSLQSNISSVIQPTSTWHVEFNPATKVALKLNLVHTLTQNTVRTYAAFSIDGKYLATVSSAGVVHIFDVETGKRIGNDISHIFWLQISQIL